ncbi:MAG: hypothetical protein FWC56_03490, partial [Phycisphaerae bacterium]|nr:hypothetical protein [Phycisphaerae bacterium]
MNNATIPAVPAVQSPESTATEPMATERTAAALNRSLRWAKILWIVVALAVAVKTIATPTIHTVFPKNTAHAMCWWQGTSLYDHIPELGHFPYLPTHAILLSPFAVLGMTVGGIVWTWFNMAVLW